MSTATQELTPPDTRIPVDRLVKAFLKMRAAKAALQKQIDEIEIQQKAVEAELMVRVKEAGATSISTAVGVAVQQVTTRFYTNDWVAFRQWVAQENATHLFESRLNQGNTKEWLEQHPDKVPPGLQSETTEKIVVKAK